MRVEANPGAVFDGVSQLYWAMTSLNVCLGDITQQYCLCGARNNLHQQGWKQQLVKRMKPGTLSVPACAATLTLLSGLECRLQAENAGMQ
jgi:hypothetical protein